MFFVRTQKAHTWRSPEYRFSRQQDAAFKVMMAAAEGIVSSREESKEESGGRVVTIQTTRTKTTRTKTTRTEITPDGRLNSQRTKQTRT